VIQALDRALRATLLAAAVAALLAGCSGGREIHSVGGLAQGTTYSVQWWRATEIDEDGFESALKSELERIDALLSTYRPDSTLERFNAVDTTDPQTLPAELVALLRLAAEVHAASDGCFDPTVRPLVRAWGFDGDEPHVPDAGALAAARARVGFDKIELVDGEHVRKRIPGVEIDMSSIGQGYTVARLAAIAERYGLGDFLVEIGGEVAGRGRRPDGRSWRVGIESPGAEGEPLRAISLPAGATTAVITSGTYRHFFEADGRRYGHILDPRTGSPVEHALVSATVAGPDAASAAAWGTALLCLGPDAGAATAERLGLAAVLIVRQGDAFVQRPTSRFTDEWPDATD
jgi:thiamine biosynthesis lipoprotein